MRIFVFMGLPYQGKTTAARELLSQLHRHPIYEHREIGYVSTDECRGWILKHEYPNEEKYTYTHEQECQSWRYFLGKIVEFMSVSPTNSILIIDGTFCEWSKVCELLDILTVNIESFATERLPLVIDFVHIGSQHGEAIWTPNDLLCSKSSKKIQERWNERCLYNESNGLMALVPEEVFNKKFEQMQQTLYVLVSTCKSFMRSYRGLIYFARHFLPHHPNKSLIHKII